MAMDIKTGPLYIFPLESKTTEEVFQVPPMLCPNLPLHIYKCQHAPHIQGQCEIIVLNRERLQDRGHCGSSSIPDNLRFP